MSKEASERKAEGKKTYDLHIGDLNFKTAPQIVQATIDAINNGKTTYAPPRGIPPLLETVARVIGEERGMHYSPEEVILLKSILLPSTIYLIFVIIVLRFVFNPEANQSLESSFIVL